MAKSVTYNKRENEKKKQARRVEKQKKKEDRKLLGKANSFDDMIAYVDENGVITSTPPELNPNKEERYSYLYPKKRRYRDIYRAEREG